MKKVISLVLIVILLNVNFAYAAEKVKFYADMQSEFTANEEAADSIIFVTNEDIKINDNVTIPPGAQINGKVEQFQKERRWHKNGYIICNLVSYSLPDDEPVDITDEEIYFIVKKYEEINKKEAGVLGTEIVLTQAASIAASCFIIFAPVDIAYFFTKGAIVRKKDPNWFKSGVMEAYDNSIFWFQLKGKPIELAEGDGIKLQSLSKDKAVKLSKKIEKKKLKKINKQNKKNKETVEID